jgi:Family of unknown function (DUF5670)
MSRFDQTMQGPYVIVDLYVDEKSDGGLVSIFTILFVVLLVAWLLGLSVFHVAGGFIHLLLIFAVISLIVHFMRRRTSST